MSRNDFTAVLRRALKRKQQRDGDYLKQFQLFHSFTSIKIQKVNHVLVKKHFVRGQCLYREGDPVDGVYLMQSGEVVYEKVTYENEVLPTSGKWMQPRLLIGDNLKKARVLQMALISGVEMIGVEEILRHIILERERAKFLETKKQEKLSQEYINSRVRELFDDNTTKNRDFTCRANSSANLYFLKIDEFLQAMRHVPLESIKNLYFQRKRILEG